MTPLRFTRRHALGRRIGAAGLPADCVTVAPGLATSDRAMPDDIDFTTDWIMPLPPPEGAGRAPILGRS